MLKLRNWLLGLVGAAINAASGGVALVVVDPHAFGDWEKLLKVCGVLAVSGAALFLKNHPLPVDEDYLSTPR